jgi:hydrogenase nickel incorporation protein HypA/HybF
MLVGGEQPRFREESFSMHELAVTESIASICLRHAEQNQASRIIKVNIKLGELTGIVDHYVSFYWDMVTKDTVAEGAELNFIKIPIRASCPHCKKEFEVKEYDLTCPECGKGDGELVSGREFLVESMEIE